MNTDDHERDTLTPDPRDNEDERHAQPPPPWERATSTGRPVPGSFQQTQPIKPPTVEDVLEVFGHFQEHILQQIDKRDERILLAIQDIGTQIIAHYERETKRDDEQDRWISQLRHRTHKHATALQAFDIRLMQIEQKLGIESPVSAPTPEEESELEA